MKMAVLGSGHSIRGHRPRLQNPSKSPDSRASGTLWHRVKILISNMDSKTACEWKLSMSNGNFERFFYWKSPSFSIDSVLSSFKFRHFIRLKSVSKIRFLDRFPDQFWIKNIGFRSKNTVSMHFFAKNYNSLALPLALVQCFRACFRVWPSNNNGIRHFWQRAVFIQKPNNLFLKFLELFVT